MCTTCGCGHGGHRLEGEAIHAHAHGHAGPIGAVHAPGVPLMRRVRVERDILAENDAHAAGNRRLLAGRGIFALNLVSSPDRARPRSWCAPSRRSAGGCR